jgi:VWFA-related protein
MRSLSLVCLLGITVGSAGLSVLSVQPTAIAKGQEAPQGQTIRVGVPLVNLYATVLDKHKAIVPNLDQKDFRVYEDSVEQKVTFFSREKTLSLRLGLLIDTSGSEANTLGFEQQAASQFLHRVLQEGDTAFVIAFDSDVDVLADWTNDVASLQGAIRQSRIEIGGDSHLPPGEPKPARALHPYAGGGTRLYDAISLECRLKMNSTAGRKVLVILTDARDEGSRINLKQAIEAAQRSDTRIQILLVYNLKARPEFEAAKQLAEETGGRTIDAYDESHLQKAFDDISEQLHNEYSLGYYPTNTKLDGKYRSLRIEMTNKDYKPLTREGYFARAAGK